jgi:hypothetical protein
LLRIVAEVTFSRAQNHLTGARYFSGELSKLEQIEYASEKDRVASRSPATWYFFSSITSATAYADAVYYEALAKSQIKESIYSLFDKKDLVTRLNCILELKDKDPIPLGGAAAQGAKAALQLRNALVHYDGTPNSLARTNAKLGKSIPLNLPSPLFDLSQPFVPFRCCSSSYADWAIQQMTAASNEFLQRLSLGELDHLRL